jgi:hypothetical protein
MSIPSREVVAEVVARFVTEHTAWDSVHQFATLNWDGEKIGVGTLAAIHPSIDPRNYPEVMSKTALDAINDQRSTGEQTLQAFLLQFEAHAVAAPAAGASAMERRQFERDNRERTFHRRPDAVEICGAYCVDVHGRLWTAVKRRPVPDDVEQHFYASPAGAPGGAFVRALRVVAQLTGAALHGLPVPVGGSWS